MTDKRLVNATRTSTKLRRLATHIKGNKEFAQWEPDRCIVGLGLRLHGSRSTSTSTFARLYGVTEHEARRLFYGDFGQLGLKNVRDALAHVTRARVERVLRKLADKYQLAGK
jgi:hypothetical protein